MIGVVVWSEQALNKAVIWCDDQGDLAFYSDETSDGLQELKPGDWVEFDLTLGGNIRIAKNLRVLMGQGSPDLAACLTAVRGDDAHPCPDGATGQQSATCGAAGQAAHNRSDKVVPFPQSIPQPPSHAVEAAVIKLKRR